MSLVGPRPERPHFVDAFAETIPAYQTRHRMPVGPLWMDIKILIRTVGHVLGTSFARTRRATRPRTGRTGGPGAHLGPLLRPVSLQALLEASQSPRPLDRVGSALGAGQRLAEPSAVPGRMAD